MPVVFKENEAGTYGPWAVVNAYHWTELFFLNGCKKPANFPYYSRIMYWDFNFDSNVDPIFFPLFSDLAPFIFTLETSIWSHLY